MKTRSLGIAFAALLAFAPVRGSAQDVVASAASANSATPAADPSGTQASVPRPSIAPKTAEPAVNDATPRKKRRSTRNNYRRYASWEPFPMYWPNYYGHRLSFRRVAWFNWF